MRARPEDLSIHRSTYERWKRNIYRALWVGRRAVGAAKTSASAAVCDVRSTERCRVPRAALLLVRQTVMRRSRRRWLASMRQRVAAAEATRMARGDRGAAASGQGPVAWPTCSTHSVRSRRAERKFHCLWVGARSHYPPLSPLIPLGAGRRDGGGAWERTAGPLKEILCHCSK